jgi:hypothetical protein
MSLRFILFVFGLAHSFALFSKDLQSGVNEKLMPGDLVKMKATDPNWKGEEIFETINNIPGLFVHRETNKMIFETKEKVWTENEIIEELRYEPDEFKNLIEMNDWNELYFRYMKTDELRIYWKRALATIVNLNKKYERQTVLMRAVLFDDSNAVKTLLERSADVSAKGSFGWTALHQASAFGYKNVETIELLLNFNAEIDVTDKLDETPLMTAIKFSKTDSVKELLVRGASLDLKNYDNRTALELAKKKRYHQGDVENEKIIDLLEAQQSKILLEQKKRAKEKFCWKNWLEQLCGKSSRKKKENLQNLRK